MSVERQNFYVYVYFRLDTAQPCYVGKGCRYRARDFRRKENAHLQRIIAKAGGALPCVIIRSGLTEPQAFEIERAFIKAIGRGRNGPLVNQTDGGEGPSGLIFSAKTRAQMSARMRGTTASADTLAKRSVAMREHHREHPRSKESYDKLVEGRKRAKAEGRSTRKSQRGIAKTNNHRAKMAASTRQLHADGKFSSAETLAKKAASMRQAWALGKFDNMPPKGPMSEETKAKIGAANRGRKQSANTRAQTSAVTRRQWAEGIFSTPEAKAKKSESLRRYWANKRASSVTSSEAAQ